MAAFRVHTDCCGIEAPLFALRGMPVNFVKTGVSDINPKCREFSARNFPSNVAHYFTDMTKRNHAHVPDHDLYICGFPCPSFSNMGKKRRFECEEGRVFHHVVATIEIKEPCCFILENVASIMQWQNGQRPAIETIKSKLESIGSYQIWVQLVNTKDHGVPQSRPRVYIIGIKTEIYAAYRDLYPFKFPEPLPNEDRLNLSDLLDFSIEGRELAVIDLPAYEFRNVTWREWKIRTSSRDDPNEDTYAIQSQLSPSRSNAMKEISPCFLHSHPEGIWITNLKRKLETNEMALLQGFKPSTIRLTCAELEFREMLGNTMSVNVLQRIMSRLLVSAGLIEARFDLDGWVTGDSQDDLVNQVGNHFG